MRARLKAILKENPGLAEILAKVISFFPFNNRISMGSSENTFECHGFLRRSRIRVYGKGNLIQIGHGAQLSRVTITVHGNNNRIIIKDDVGIASSEWIVEDDKGLIEVGERTGLSGNVHLAAIEGKRIVIGKDCMFSANITIRVGDSHSVVCGHTGLRINPSKDVIIGDHVWIGNQVILLKGACIPSNCIVGSGAVVTKAFTEPNTAIAGNPANVVKRNINWCVERL